MTLKNRPFVLCLLAALYVACFAVPVTAWPGEPPAEEEEGAVAEFGKPKIEMKPFNLALVRKGRVEGKVTMHLVLVIEEEGAREKVRYQLPQIRSDFNNALTILARQRFSISRPIDPDIVKEYLTAYADHRLGAGVVSVFVKQALIEPN